MDGHNILKKIIEENGHCGAWVTTAVCAACPMSRLVMRNKSSYLSCIEALGANEMSEEDADQKYKEVASRLLLEEAIDDLLRGNDDVTK